MITKVAQYKVSKIFIALSLAAFGVGCNGGDTDGGNTAGGIGNPLTSGVDSNSSGSIEIEFTEGNTLPVTQIAGFRVKLKDANGQGIKFIRVFCESERGIAIIEPSANGTAFESTDENGELSGKIGGLTPGSYLMECRASQGFNLVARKTLIITGTVPQGFIGFPGAAGGNLGGGSVNDGSFGLNDGGVRITGFQLNDAGTNGVGLPIDLVQQSDCDGDVTTTDPEAFNFTNYQITLQNQTTQRISVETVRFTVRGANGGNDVRIPSQDQTVEIARNTSGSVTGLFLTGALRFVNTSVVATQGTYTVTITITGTGESGETFEVQQNSTASFSNNVNNCS
jgi:hypothetical protein